MTFRDDAVAAIRAGWNAEIGDPNPYNDGGKSLALAQCWRRGYQTMLTIRTAATGAMQEYLGGRLAAGITQPRRASVPPVADRTIVSATETKPRSRFVHC
nr:hypothetical protein [Mycobacterium gordonae]